MSVGSIVGLSKHIDMEIRSYACPSVFQIISIYVMEWLLPIFICIIFILTTKEFELIWYRMTKRYRDRQDVLYDTRHKETYFS